MIQDNKRTPAYRVTKHDALAFLLRACCLRNAQVTGSFCFGDLQEVVNVRKRVRFGYHSYITKEDVLRHSEKLLDPENAIYVSTATHKAIHYGTGQNKKMPDGERKPGDTCPWKRA